MLTSLSCINQIFSNFIDVFKPFRKNNWRTLPLWVVTYQFYPILAPSRVDFRLSLVKMSSRSTLGTEGQARAHFPKQRLVIARESSLLFSSSLSLPSLPFSSLLIFFLLLFFCTLYYSDSYSAIFYRIPWLLWVSYPACRIEFFLSEVSFLKDIRRLEANLRLWLSCTRKFK